MSVPPLRYARTADGVDISCVRLHGEGTPFVLAPGLGAPPLPVRFQIGSFLDLCSHLRRGAPLITLDFRGTGLSGSILGELTIEHLALDLAAVVEDLAEPIHLIGIFGAGTAAAVLSADRPDLVKSLTLVRPYRRGVLPERFFIPAAHVDLEQFLFWLLRTIFDFPQHDSGQHLMPAYISGLPRATFDQWVNNLQGVDMADYLPRVRKPVLVWAGSESANAAEVAALLPSARLSLPGQQFAYNATYGDALRDAFDAFWAEVSDEDAAPSPSSDGGLSPRELDVLRLLAAGKSNKHIAEALVLSEATIATHVRHILQKTDSANRAEATAYAVRNGLA